MTNETTRLGNKPQLWLIFEEETIRALHDNGFRCDHNQPSDDELASIMDLSQLSQEQRIAEKAALQSPQWYTTDCPISGNSTYELGDGRVLISQGTQLRVMLVPKV